MELEIKNLHVSVEGKKILKGVDLKVKQGEIHALMGPNGSGKSTLAYTLLGHPKYKIEEGNIFLGEKDITKMKPHERAKLGLFLAFQHPVEVPGVTISSVLWTIYKGVTGDGKYANFKKVLEKNLKLLGLDESFAARQLNAGLSGGEKKRAEVLQMLVTDPKIAVLDETDSGLDIDSLKTVAKGISSMRSPKFGALVITHYQRILDYIEPDYVHVLIDGKIEKTGGKELVRMLEKSGYSTIKVKAK